VAVRTTVLCIVSGERLSGSDFVAALRESLRPHEQLEIIVDRRSGEPTGEWERREERRRRPQVDLALRANGFAFVPAEPSSDRMPSSNRLMGSERTTGSDPMGSSDRSSGSDRMFTSERMPESDRMGSDRMPTSDRMPNYDRMPGTDREPGQDRMPSQDRKSDPDRMPGRDRNWTPEDEDDDRDWSPSDEGRSRSRLSMLLPSGTGDRDVDDVGNDDEERLEAIRDFKRERSGGLVPWLVVALIAAAVAAFLLSPTGQTVRSSVMSLVSSTAPSSSPSQSASETTAPSPEAEKPPQPAAPRGSGAVGAPRENNTSATGSARPTESAPAAANAPTGSTSPSTSAPPAGNAPPVDGGAALNASAPKVGAAPDAGTAPSTRAPANSSSATVDRSRARAESAAPPRESAQAAPRTRSAPGEVQRPSSGGPRETASATPAPDAVSRTIAPRFAGLPRVELIREGGSSGAYAVKIADPAGKPLSDAEVLLIARMADGTLENVRMGFVPEQGAYRGTLPPVRSTPVDLRIRVITGDKRVEIPVGP
jgi:hypothetical protein